MILRFRNPNLSITSFDDVDLPDLTVLTGVNGSGKTHLLQSIQGRMVTLDGVDSSSIVTFNYETFRLENETPFSAHEIAVEKQNAYAYFDGQLRANLRAWRGALNNDLPAIVAQARARNTPYWNIRDSQALQLYKSQISAFFSQPHMQGQQFTGPLLSLIKSSNMTIEDMTKDDFYSHYKPLTYKNDFLPQAIGRVIWDYYIRFMQNELNGFRNTKHNLSLPFFTEEEFVKRNGEKPWVVINNILKQFSSLEYQVLSPEGLDIFESYHLRLVHTRNPELRIEFSNLSSGERVLMALVASVYKSASDNHFPDLFLLDELDATLHPSMMKSMLRVVQDEFVARGTKVILVTHSPSTVAFAPEDSIFVMNKAGRQRIEKRAKKDALAILTEGFATLEEGMLLFDQVAGGKISIITEGRNTNFLSEALRHFCVQGVHVIDGLEASTGKNQLKTLFEFMCKVPHKGVILFVWDCDVSYNLIPDNNTYPLFFIRNPSNSIAKGGIENMFGEHLFSDFKKTITLSRGHQIIEFDDARKKDFEQFIFARNNPADFQHFTPLINEIRRIQAQGVAT